MASKDTPSVMVVDDYREMTTIVRRQLEALDIRDVHAVTDSAVALELLRQQPVDLVIADWNMSPLSGLALLQEIRADAQLAGLPVVMISATASGERVTEARRAKVNHFLVKPFSTRTLGQCLEVVLGWRKTGGHVA